jgi:hypothetical protein
MRRARQIDVGDGARHQQGFGGVAGAVALGLGILDDRHGLDGVGLVVDVDVAVAVEVLDHRHARIGGICARSGPCRRAARSRRRTRAW